MKRIFLCIFFLLFPVLAYAQPSINFDSEVYDFGTIDHGEEIEHTFEFTNTGDKELVIERLKTS
jgi:hypothetical protein